MTATSFGRLRTSNVTPVLKEVLGWVVVPILLAIVVVLLYNQVIYRIEPETMTYRMFFDQTGRPAKLTRYILLHMEVVFVSALLAVLTAVPAGILITREGFRDFAPLILGVANIGQTVPSMAILGLSMAFLGIGFKPSIFALWFYSLLPIVRNTATGIDEVDRAVIEAARGMGMTKRQILFRIELPLALNIIFAGIRTAVVINVGTAALVTFIGWPTLGHPIAAGLRVRRTDMVVVASILIAVFAIGLDFIMGKVQQLLAPRGV
ncbi:MAG: ABC transporter permease [Chloroflexi bacterium]|nr:MAG: ABC transporter permease [Chloroflexota bacterium]